MTDYEEAERLQETVENEFDVRIHKVYRVDGGNQYHIIFDHRHLPDALKVKEGLENAELVKNEAGDWEVITTALEI